MKESLVMSRSLMSHLESVNDRVDSWLISQVIYKLKRASHRDVTCVGICDSFLKCAAMKWCWLFSAALSVCSTDERVISSHKDGTVKVWNLTPNQVATNEEHTVGHRSDYHQITAMTFNGDWMIAGKQSLPSFWLRSKCLVCCQHIDSWSGMRALIWYICRFCIMLYAGTDLVSVSLLSCAGFVYCH